MPKSLLKISVINEGKSATHSFEVDSVIVGRDPAIDLPIPNDLLSRKHVRFFVRDHQIYVEDLGSRNGTSVNKTMLTPNSPILLHPEDKVILSKSQLFLQAEYIQQAPLDAELLQKQQLNLSLECTIQANQATIAEMQTALCSKEELLKSVQSNLDEARASLNKVQTDLNHESIQLKQAKEEARKELSELNTTRDHERKDYEILRRRLQAETETIEAQNKALQHKLEAGLEMLQMKKAVAEKETQQLQLKKEDLDKALAELRQLMDNAVTKRKAAEAESAELIQKKTAIQSELAQIELSTKNARAEHSRILANNNEVRQKLERELESLRLEQIKHVDAELAQMRLDVEHELEQIRAKEIAALRSRSNAAIQAVVQAVTNLMQSKIDAVEMQHLTQEVAHVAQCALDNNRDPKEATLLPESKRARQFWQRTGLYALACMALIIILLRFPNLPSQLTRSTYRSIASRSSMKDNVFLDAIRKKSEKYRFEKAPVYRTSYVENVLYTEGYVSMKTDERFQAKWTHSLNDFFIGRLGLDDRVIVEFVASETVLVKELASIEDNIGVQFKDIGIKKLEDTEAKALPKLQGLIGGRDNYSKFRNFEKAFYEDYLRR